MLWGGDAAGHSSALHWSATESSASQQLPSATALGKRKATSPPPPDSDSHPPQRPFPTLPVRPTLAVAPSLLLRSFLDPSAASTLPSASAPLAAPSRSSAIASSYDDFWAKLGSPSVLPAPQPPVVSATTSPGLRSPPSPLSISTTHRSPLRTKSPFTAVTIFPPKDKPSLSSFKPTPVAEVPRSNGRPLGPQASFSALPPIEPLPFAPEQSGLRRGEDSSLDLGSHSGSSDGLGMVRRQVEADDFAGASQEEEISLQALDDAFGGEVRLNEEGGE